MGKLISLKYFQAGLMFAMLIFSFEFMIGCAAQLKYPLKKKDVIVSDSSYKMQILVTRFSDLRPQEERTVPVKEMMGYKDISNYTSDDEYEEIKDRKDTIGIIDKMSTMVSEHIAFSKVFREVQYATVPESQISNKFLDSLHNAGTDAILTGGVNHFFSYYHRDAIDELVPIPFMLAFAVPIYIASFKSLEKNGETPSGSDIVNSTALLIAANLATYLGGMLGRMIVDTRERDYEWNIRFSARLISTADYEILWENEVESSSKGKKVLPGDCRNKFELLSSQLKEATNKMVKSLLQSSLKIQSVNRRIE